MSDLDARRWAEESENVCDMAVNIELTCGLMVPRYTFSLRPLVMYAVTAWDVLYDPLAVLIDAFKLVEAWGLIVTAAQHL